MGSKHKTTLIDRARDELFSHVIRCDVLEAHMADRKDWLADTMDFMAHRYPQLSEIQLAQVEVMGQRFIKPAIPHGSESTATNRKDWQKAIPVAGSPDENEGILEDAASEGTADDAPDENEPELAAAAAS